MAEPTELELAPLPREEVGPFLLLGLEKRADDEAVEAHWAERLKWARRQQLVVPLEDINWARELLRDPERRLRADVASLNTDLQDGLLARLAERYGGTGPRWQPLDEEPDLSQYQPPVELPDAEALRASVQVPEIPQEFPAALLFLEEWVAQPLDAWDVNLPTDPPLPAVAKDPPP